MTTYSVTDLSGKLDGYYPIPSIINNSGVVAGTLNNQFPFRYKNDKFVSLETPWFTTDAAATGISPSNPERIAGWIGQFGVFKGTVWTDGVYFNVHPFIGSLSSEAYDINDNGIVVGQANSPDYGNGYRFDTTTQQVEMLVASNGDSIWPYSINNSGHVAGFTATPYTSGTRLFFWDQTMHVIPTPGDVPFYDIDINDSDVIATYYRTASGKVNAFTYDFKSQVFTDINGAAFLGSTALCINNHGVVVGSCWDASGTYAMIWTASDGMRRLIDLVDMQSGWTFSSATAINDAGQITGAGIFFGQQRAFLLTPGEGGESKPKYPKDLVEMVREIILAGGGMGILLPGGGVIYPKDGPVDPDSPLQRQDAARSDAAIGLAMRVLAQRITDRSTRAMAERAAADITRSAAASTGSPRSAAGRSNWLSRLVRDIADELER